MSLLLIEATKCQKRGGPGLNKQRFLQVLSTLKGMNIGVFFQNGQFVEGVLLDIKSDHLIIDVNNKIFYIATNQIFAFLKNAKDHRVRSTAASYLDRVNFKDVLNSLKYNWVTINGLNNQTFTGLLTTIMDDYIMLINDEEQLFIHRPLISNIFNGIYETKAQPIPIKKDVVQDPLIDDGELSNRSETLREETGEDQTVHQIVENQEQSLTERELQESPEATKEGFVSVIEETSTDDFSSVFGKSPVADLTSVLEGNPTEDNASMLDEESITVNDLNIAGDYIQENTKGYKEDRKEADPSAINMNMNFHEEHLVHKGSCANKNHLVYKGSCVNKHHLKHKRSCLNKHRISSDCPLDTDEKNKLLDQSASLSLKNNACLKNSALSNYMWNDNKQKNLAIPPKGKIKKEDSVPSSKMSPEEQRKMLRMQYYSLMKHAEKMYHQLSDN